MTTEEKAAAFDVLAMALTNRWHDGSWTWWASAPCGGLTKRATRGEAIQDLIEWSKKKARLAMRIQLPVSVPVPSQPEDGGQLRRDGESAADGAG